MLVYELKLLLMSKKIRKQIKELLQYSNKMFCYKQKLTFCTTSVTGDHELYITQLMVTKTKLKFQLVQA